MNDGTEIVAKNEILNMSAGKDLDILIEQKIFHHEVFTKEATRKTSNVNKRKQIKYTVKEAWFMITKYSSAPVLSYSTNIQDAFMVVEKMSEIANIVMWQEPDFWVVKFGIGNESVKANTAPLAICRAALLTVNRKV
jgi:hypothetical protein